MRAIDTRRNDTRKKISCTDRLFHFDRFFIHYIGIVLGLLFAAACDPDFDSYDPLKGPIHSQTGQSSSSGAGGAGGAGGTGGTGGAGGNSMVCTPGSAAICYTGFVATLNVGACKAGTITCNAGGTGYGACEGEITPIPEDCNTIAVDDNCDGMINEGCP